MPGERVATEAGIWLGASMDLCMTFQVVTSNEALSAMIATELSITKMGLDMRLDVLFPAEALVAIFVLAHPLVIDWIWAFNELSNVIDGNVGLFDGCLDTRLKIEIGD